MRKPSTPLHYAARFGHLLAARVGNNTETVAALLNAGADGSVRDTDDRTPFDVAKKHNRGTLEGTAVWWRLHDARFL